MQISGYSLAVFSHSCSLCVCTPGASSFSYRNRSHSGLGPYPHGLILTYSVTLSPNLVLFWGMGDWDFNTWILGKEGEGQSVRRVLNLQKSCKDVVQRVPIYSTPSVLCYSYRAGTFITSNCGLVWTHYYGPELTLYSYFLSFYLTSFFCSEIPPRIS